MNLLDRFFAKVAISPGCWEWIGAKSVPYGYGKLYVDGKFMRAHRFSYDRLVGPIPEGAIILHRCDNRSCVNPDHLTAGTQAENVRDMETKGRDNRCGRVLTYEQRKAISKDTRTLNAIASEYGVTQGAIVRIRRSAKKGTYLD